MDSSQKQTLVATLRRLATAITANIEHPNYGGCAVVAAIVGKQLSQFTDVEVLVQDWNRDNAANINTIKLNHNTDEFKFTGDWNKAGLNFSHVMLKVKVGDQWMSFDSDGVSLFKESNFCKGTMTLAEIKKLAGTQIGWNRTFDRHQILKLRRIVGKVLQPIRPLATC